MAHGGRNCAVLLEPVFGRSHQVRCVGTVVPVSEGQVCEDLPGILHRDLGQDKRIGHLRIIIPVAGEAVVGFSALHLAQDFLLPVHIVILGFFLALAGQFLQNRLSVFDGGGEHLLPVLRYSFKVKFVNVCIILRVGVHHQTLKQRFVIRLDEYRHKAFFDTFPFGIAVCRHDGIIVLHGGEIGAFTVQILHQRLSQFGGFQRVLVEVLSLPVGEAFLDHLCHGLVVVLVKRDEQWGLKLELIGVILFWAEIFQGIVFNVTGEIWTIRFAIVVRSKCSPNLIEHRNHNLPVQFVPNKRPQIHTGRVGFDLFGHFAVFVQKVLAHQIMLYAPAEVNGKEVISIYGVNGQPLLLNTLDMIGSIVHLTVKIIIGKGSTSDSILTIRLHHKADAVHFVQQGIRVMGQLIFQFIPVERDHLIEVDLLAARQDADLAAIFGILGTGQNGSAQLCILCKVLFIVHGMTEAQPGIAGNGKAGQGFQQANGPVPSLILQVLTLQFPVPRQRDSKLRPLQLVFGQFLRHIHPVGTHAHGYQGVVVPIPRGRHHADVHMDVRGRQLVEHILKLAEILLNVPLDSFHFFLGVDLGNTGFLILGRFAIRVIVIIVRVTVR